MRTIDVLEDKALGGALAVLGALPYGWSERWLRVLSGLVGPVAGVRRGVVDDQLACAFPHLPAGDRRRLRNAVYDHLGRTVAETFLADPQRLAATVRVEPGFDALDAAMAAGRGVIAVTAHLGNFELGGRVLAARYRLLDVVKPQRNPAFDRRLAALRQAHGIATVPMERSLRPVLRHLRGGGLVTLLIDQDAGASGVPVPFLGRTASAWPGAARLALRTGCPVVPVAITRTEEGHVLHVGQAVAPLAGDNSPEAIREFMTRITAAVETWVLQHPDQWFWVHRRWKGAERVMPAAPTVR